MREEEHSAAGNENSALDTWSMDEKEFHEKWNDGDRKTITEYLAYFENPYNFVNDLKANCCSSFEMPKKPKSKIESLMRQEKKASTKLEGKELHLYLMSKLVKESDIVNSEHHILDLSILDENLSIEEMKQHLISGYNFVKKEECKLFRAYLDYGEWLDSAFKLFQKSSSDMTWPEWLEVSIGIGDRYARELRSLSIQFKSCKKFRNLSITLSEIKSLKNEITKLLNTERSFWEEEY